METVGERRFAYSFASLAAAVSAVGAGVVGAAAVVVVVGSTNSSFAFDQTIELSVNDLLVASSNS